jgi:hypothetical protein
MRPDMVTEAGMPAGSARPDRERECAETHVLQELTRSAGGGEGDLDPGDDECPGRTARSFRGMSVGLTGFEPATP